MDQENRACEKIGTGSLGKALEDERELKERWKG